jgi:hypothetical protein
MTRKNVCLELPNVILDEDIKMEKEGMKRSIGGMNRVI